MTSTLAGRANENPGAVRRVLGDAWRRNLETILAEEGPVQFVLFTGDAAQSGSPGEYERSDGLLGLIM